MAIKIPKNDYGFDLNFTITDADGTAVDLTSTTVSFRVAKEGYKAIIDATCSIVDATAGTCKYTAQTGDFDVVDTYGYEVEVAGASQVNTARGSDEIKIIEELG